MSMDVTVDYMELFDFLRGKLLGSGATRDVYEFLPEPDKYVLKVEKTPCDNENRDWMQNTQEWLFWNNCAKSAKRWLAPCLQLSRSGKYLLQRRATPITKQQRPLRLPAFITDIKDANLGIVDGKVVMVDYGLLAATSIYNANMRLRKVRYYD
jgi:hypothetical protein